MLVFAILIAVLFLVMASLVHQYFGLSTRLELDPDTFYWTMNSRREVRICGTVDPDGNEWRYFDNLDELRAARARYKKGNQ